MKHDPWRFFQVPERRYDLLEGIYFLAIASACALLPVFTTMDATGLWTALGFTVFFGGLSVYHFLRSRRANPNGIVFLHPDAAPADVQLAFYRRLIWLSLLAFPFLTVYTARELALLESGAKDQAFLPEPLGWIYEHMGYVPTVVSIPLVGALALAVFFNKIRKLKRRGPSGVTK